MDTTTGRFEKGDRVQVMNPGPMSAGTVLDDRGALNVWVEWDDGSRGWPQAALLVAAPSPEAGE